MFPPFLESWVGPDSPYMYGDTTIDCALHRYVDGVAPTRRTPYDPWPGAFEAQSREALNQESSLLNGRSGATRHACSAIDAARSRRAGASCCTLAQRCVRWARPLQPTPTATLVQHPIRKGTTVWRNVRVEMMSWTTCDVNTCPTVGQDPILRPVPGPVGRHETYGARTNPHHKEIYSVRHHQHCPLTAPAAMRPAGHLVLKRSD